LSPSLGLSVLAAWVIFASSGLGDPSQAATKSSRATLRASEVIPPASQATPPSSPPADASQPAPPAAPPSTPAAPPSTPAGRISTDPRARQHNPIVRIGLTTDRNHIVLSSREGFRVLDAASRRPLGEDVHRGSLTVGLRGAKPTEERVYKVQVGSFATQEAAEEFAAKLRASIGEPVAVSRSADRGSWRVRAGAADSRAGLVPVVDRLPASVWIVDEAVPQSGATTLVLVDEDYDATPVDAKVLAVEAASPDGLLAVDGASYRGSLEVRLDASGGIRVINIVPLESYLRGVVPAELGPIQYPEIEALKAQAVAARTYTHRNLGQFADEGFDLCDTPRCQVYGGVKAEHPLSDRAVAETDGEIAAYEPPPIDASNPTCGGHTEDAAVIFPRAPSPIRRGRRAPEQRSRKARAIVLEGSASLGSAPAEEARAAALLAAHRLVPRAALDPSALAAPIPGDEAASWIEDLAQSCGIASPEAAAPQAKGRRKEDRAPLTVKWRRKKAASAPGTESAMPDAPTLADLAVRLVERLAWQERVDLLVGREEPSDWLPDGPEGMDDAHAAAVAYFLRQKGWPAGPGGSPEPLRRATRGDFARLLLFTAEDCDLFELHDVTVRGGSSRGLKLSGKTYQGAPALAQGGFLFADVGAGPVPVGKVALLAGDKVRVHLGNDDRIDVLFLLPGRQGTSDDRFSSLSSWQVAYTAQELGKKLEESVGQGELIDLVPVRRGVSGRVTEMRVTGSAGQRTISGFDIRTALGLKENLFVMARQKDRNGALRRVVFTGRGWGHGVGLCQVGAYGMALRGASHREILTHYYRGITLERLK
jgi:stage II sporulation protein D